MKTCLKFWLMACFFKNATETQKHWPSASCSLGGSCHPCTSESSQYFLVALETKAEEPQQKVHLEKKILMPFYIPDAWLWISIQNAGCFLLPGSDWESVEGCLSFLMLGISQAVNSIWASLPPLMFSTIYNESFGRHLKPCKVLNH